MVESIKRLCSVQGNVFRKFSWASRKTADAINNDNDADTDVDSNPRHFLHKTLNKRRFNAVFSVCIIQTSFCFINNQNYTSADYCKVFLKVAFCNLYFSTYGVLSDFYVLNFQKVILVFQH